MRMNREWAEAFAKDWVEAWNAHDLPRVLSHYAEDFTMSSPFIADIAGEPSGTLAGKAAVRAYWSAALQRMPTLRFKLEAVLLGAGSIVLLYQTSFGKRTAEVLCFNSDGVVQRAAAHYVDAP